MKKDYKFLIENVKTLSPLELRTLNRYYLHPKGKRCCNHCFKIYDDYIKHFHIKKQGKNGPSYNVMCASCFNEQNRKRIAEYRKSPHQFIKAKFTSYLHRAKKEKFLFNLIVEDLIELWDKQQGLCFYTEEKMSFEYVTEKHKAPHIFTPSLDRLDPKKGYTKGNVAWCCYGINRMKNDFDYKTFLLMCKRILIVRKKNDK